MTDDPETLNVQLILVDVVEPRAPAGVNAVTIKADLTDTQQIDSLFSTTYGVPETIYCLHGIMSRGSEDNFDFGVKVDFVFSLSVFDRNTQPYTLFFRRST